MRVIDLTSSFLEPDKQEISICGEDLTELYKGMCTDIPDDIRQLEIFGIANIDDSFKELSICVESEG